MAGDETPDDGGPGGDAAFDRGMAFLLRLADMVSRLGYSNAKLARLLAERAQVEDQRARAGRELTLANRILRVFVEQEGDALFDQALAVVQEGMSSMHGVFGYIAEPGHLVCPSLSKMLDACEVPGKCIHYPPEKWKGLWARALTEKRSLYTNEAPPVPRGHPAIHNNLAAPILFRGEAIGLLNLANKEGGYTDEDRDVLDAIAARVAPVLYAWIQRKLREDAREAADEALRKALDDSRRYAAELTRSNRDLEQFAYVVSHDLKEPLRMVTGFTSLLKTDYAGSLDAKADQYIGFAADAARRMQALVDDLLAYGRVGRNAATARVEAATAVQEAMRNLKTAIDESGARIVCDPLPAVQANPVELVQLFQNLLGNAVKFRRPDVTPEVRIRVERGATAPGAQGAAPAFCRFSVSDNGIGIEPRYFGKLFTIFERLHPADRYAGTGIGLAICRKIVERHGGDIGVNSEAGAGTTFWFTLPEAWNG